MKNLRKIDFPSAFIMSEAHTPVLTLDEIKGGPIAEQLNAWLNGFEAQLRQMSATHYDFCVDVLMLLYKEMAEGRMLEKERELSEEFWDAVEDIAQEN
jgi:hypothetical protein